MEGILGRRFLVLVMVAVAAVSTTQTEAQDLSCTGDLSACYVYYNDTALTPSQECCVPLENAFKKQLPCICAVFTDPTVQKTLGIDLQKGMGLVSRCNITGVSADACTPAPAPSPKIAPTPGKSPSSGAPFGAEWIGLSAFFSLFLFIMA